MEEFILFVLTFIFFFLIYQLFLVRPAKKSYLKDGKVKKELLEIRYLRVKYPLNFKKIPYLQLLQLCAITSCLDMAIAVTIVSLVKSFIWEIIVGFVVVCVLIYTSYYLVYLFYKKKGMIKNGKHK